ncbi:MAG TPA: hypothetical protein PKH79_04930 [Prolixibacteraceae bacterium]|nr:hypothetical protein [Prolixibacteraceae bacterium]
MKKFLFLIGLIACSFLFSCSDKAQTEKLFRYFLNKHVERIKPITRNMNEAVWDAYTGKTSFKEVIQQSNHFDSLYIQGDRTPEYYQRLLNNLYDNTTEFEMLMKIKKSGLITDSLLKRQFVKVYREYVSIQNNWEKSEKRKEHLYEQFYELMKTQTHFMDSIGNVSAEEKNAQWIEKFSPLIEKFRDLVKAMNDDVKRMGYKNYFQSLMSYYDVDYDSLDQIVQVIDEETKDDYIQLLHVCQTVIGRKYQIAPGKITPFQYREAHGEMVVPCEWEREYSRDEFLKMVERYYALGNYDISDIYKNSDIWYRENKLNHSFFFCLDVDKCDFRIYANCKPSAKDINSMAHEFGHAVHYKYVDPRLPYLLRDPHSIIAEAVAIYFDSKVYTSNAVQQVMGLASLEKNPYFVDFKNPAELFYIRKLLRNIKFEKSIFENPDQDFNALWWMLNKEYLLFDTASSDQLPEWISNQQIVDFNGAHVFYLYAIAFAAQLETYFPDGQIGQVRDKILKYGDSLAWDDLIKRATGEPLNLKYLIHFYKRQKSVTNNLGADRYLKRKGIS